MEINCPSVRLLAGETETVQGAMPVSWARTGVPDAPRVVSVAAAATTPTTISEPTRRSRLVIMGSEAPHQGLVV